jgi:hypothetical protein
MVKKLFLLAIMATACLAASSASKIDGKWKASMQSPDGNSMDLVFTFKVDGEKLTGTVTSPMGGDMELKDGVVKGDEFSFSVDAGMGDPIKHKCKLEGDVIKMKFEMPGGMGGDGPSEMTLKKVE